MFCISFSFLEKPKQKKGVDIFSQKEDVKKKVKKTKRFFVVQKFSKKGKVQKEHEHKAARIQSTHARGGCANDESGRGRRVDVVDDDVDVSVGETRALTERNRLGTPGQIQVLLERRRCFFFSHFSVISIIGRENATDARRDENPNAV